MHRMRMATKRFSQRLHILVSDDESLMLDQLAEKDGVTPSDVVRRLIRRAYAELGGDIKPLTPKRKARKKTSRA